MKGGLVEIVFALRALHELGLRPSVTPVVFVNTDEEIGSVDSSRFIRCSRAVPSGRSCSSAGEGAGREAEDRAQGCSAGSRLTVHGRPAHAGADFEHGVSAILELSHQVQRLFALNDPAHGRHRQRRHDRRRAPPERRRARGERGRRRARADGGCGAQARAGDQRARAGARRCQRSRSREASAARRWSRCRATGRCSARRSGSVTSSASSSRTPASSAAARTRTRRASSRPRSTGSGRSATARTRRTSMSTPAAARADGAARAAPARAGRPAASAARRPGRASRRRSARGRPGRVASARRRTRHEPPDRRGVAALGIEAGARRARARQRPPRTETVVLGRLDILPTLDGVEPGLLELLRLERRGVRVLNPAAALATAHDKLLTARLLARAGLPHPRTAHLRPAASCRARTAARRQAATRQLGRRRLPLRRRATASKVCLEELRTRPWFRRRGVLVQELIPPVGHDLRLVVARGAVVGAVRRTSRAGEWRTNVSLGATRTPVVPPPAACALAIAAAAAARADLVGVDLLPVGDGFAVIELNGAVEFNATYSLPGRDVFRDTAEA